MSAPAEIPLAILSIAAPLGAIDALYFHVWRLRLYDRPDSRVETATHVARALILFAIVGVLANYRPHGLWFWLVAGLIVADLVNNVLDVLTEQGSRAAFGGLSRAEYLVHIVGSTAAGAAGASFLALAWPQAALPTALAPGSGLPAWQVANGNAIAVGALLLALLETGLMARSIARARAPQPAPT